MCLTHFCSEVKGGGKLVNLVFRVRHWGLQLSIMALFWSAVARCTVKGHVFCLSEEKDPRSVLNPPLKIAMNCNC